MNTRDIIQSLQNADWSGVSIGNKAILKAAIQVMMDIDKDGLYRERATKAEQENARLREQLAKPEKYAGLQKVVTEMLHLPIDTPQNEIVQVIKYLRNNKDLYEAGREARVLTGKERQEILDAGVAAGKQIVIDKLLSLQQKGEL